MVEYLDKSTNKFRLDAGFLVDTRDKFTGIEDEGGREDIGKIKLSKIFWIEMVVEGSGCMDWGREDWVG